MDSGLYVVATPIGHLGDISLRALWTLAHSDRIACEDTRVSGGMLTKYGIKKPLLPYHDHNADTMRPQILKYIADGEAVALISDAGMPLIADPGYKLVRACRAANYTVTVIPGANAALMAMAGSGLPTDSFYFAGFLPPKATGRQKAIAALRDVQATLLFYEAPQRLGAALADLAHVLGGDRPCAVARELTKLFEETRRGSLAELAAFYSEHAAKGEITLVVGPPLASQPALQDVDALLKEYLTTMSLRDAVAAVSVITGIKKADVYASALKSRSQTQ